MSLKVATWNLEHASRLLFDNPNDNIMERHRRVRETIEDIAPDILRYVEGPKGGQAVTNSGNDLLQGDYAPVLVM